MPLAWITGANGLIGNQLVALAPNSRTVRGLTRRDFDLTDYKSVRQAFHEQRPSVIIHCAAISKSPVCQADPLLARKVNVEVTARLAELAADVPFIFFSTDLVFDGRQGNYDESAPVNPLSVYAETKAEAEKIVLANPIHTVVRTSLNGGISPTGDRGFNEEIRRAWHEGRILNLFTDEYRSPIPASTTAQAVWELVAQNRSGLFHLAGSQRLSRWQIGQVLALRHPDLKPKLLPGSLKEYNGAPRPPDTSLNCAKVQKLLSFPLPGLIEWLASHPDEPF